MLPTTKSLATNYKITCYYKNFLICLYPYTAKDTFIFRFLEGNNFWTFIGMTMTEQSANRWTAFYRWSWIWAGPGSVFSFLQHGNKKNITGTGNNADLNICNTCICNICKLKLNAKAKQPSAPYVGNHLIQTLAWVATSFHRISVCKTYFYNFAIATKTAYH